MSVSFPASHLSSYDVGKRLKVITKSGAIVTDVLTQITASFNPDRMETRLFLQFVSVLSTTAVTHRDDRGFEVDPSQFVKRVDA